MLCGIDAIPPAADDGARDDFGDGDEFGETLLFGTIITQSARWKNTATAPRVNGTRRLTSVYHENARLPPDRVLPRAYARHGIGEAPATGAINKKKQTPTKIGVCFISTSVHRRADTRRGRESEAIS